MILVVPLHFLISVVSLVSYNLSRVSLVVLYPKFYLDPWWVRLQLARGNAVCELLWTFFVFVSSFFFFFFCSEVRKFGKE